MDLEGIRSWVDATSINSVFSGLILILMAFWASYLLARLWQRSLAEDLADVIAHAQTMGLKLVPAGIRTRVEMRGSWDTTDATVTWKGGIFGEWTVVTMGDRIRRLPLITRAEELDAALLELQQNREADRAAAEG